MTGVDPKGLSQAAFEDKIEAIAHRWAIASYNKALGRTFEDIDAIKVELRRAITPLKGTPVAWQWRHRSKRKDGWHDWSDWHAGRRESISTATYESEERPLFASEPLPETEEKAQPTGAHYYTFIGDDCPPGYRRVGSIDVADPADVSTAHDRGLRIGSIYDGRSGSCAEPCTADIYERPDDTLNDIAAENDFARDDEFNSPSEGDDE
jgi:hypothetical protein